MSFSHTTMRRSTAIVALALALLSGGCSSLRPPEQAENVRHNEERDSVTDALMASYYLGALGYVIYGFAR